MFAASKTDSVSVAAPDGQFNYVTMLLHGDGTNGAQNNTFLDSSTNNFTITRNGNTTQGSFSPYGSGWSNFFDGTGDYLSIADNAALDLGTGDFTIECWVFPTTGISDVDGLISKRSTSTFDGGDWRIAYRSASTAFGLAAGSNTTDRLTPAITLNAWNHIAFVRASGTLSCYANGTRGDNLTWTTNIDNAFPLLIGLNVTGYDFPGYISNVRIVKGTAVYSGATYTVPTTPLTAITNTSLLTCQSNRFIDNSTNNFAITVNGNPSVQRFNPFGTSTAYSTSVIGGSGCFDAVADTLDTATSSALNIGTGAFQIDFWMYNTASPGQYMGPFGTNNNGGSGGIFFANRSGNLDFTNNYDTAGAISTPYPRINEWHHIALVRNSSNVRSFYLDGVRVGSLSNSVDFNQTQFIIGAYNASFGGWAGYVSNFRAIIGSNIADPTLTTIAVPTSPNTAVTNTQLLMNFTNGGIYDNAMMNDLETRDNAQISTSVKKYGTGSLAFDGSDWLKAPNSPNFDMGAGNFTIEGWFYQLGTGGQICCKYEASYQASWAIGFDGSNWDVYTYYGSTSNLPIYTGVAGPSLNTWNHFALERNGSNIEFYLNGSRVAQVAAQTMRTTTSAVAIGNLGQGYDSYFNGYIDDLRITKGYARYSGTTYTMPTAAFSDTGPY